jgi:hypothetical protein
MISALKGEYGKLHKKCSSVKDLKDSYNQTISIYNELYAIRFDLKELKLLRHTIREIASANNIPPVEAVKKIFRDINEQIL